MPRRVRPMRGETPGPTLIYDGECGLCRDAVDLLRRWDREQVLRFVPFQDGAAAARFGIALPALAAAMHLVLPDGRVLAGADAAPELLRLLPGKRWLARWFRVPAWIAARRRCLVRGVPPR